MSTGGSRSPWPTQRRTWSRPPGRADPWAVAEAALMLLEVATIHGLVQQGSPAETVMERRERQENDRRAVSDGVDRVRLQARCCATPRATRRPAGRHSRVRATPPPRRQRGCRTGGRRPTAQGESRPPPSTCPTACGAGSWSPRYRTSSAASVSRAGTPSTASPCGGKWRNGMSLASSTRCSWPISAAGSARDTTPAISLRTPPSSSVPGCTSGYTNGGRYPTAAHMR